MIQGPKYLPPFSENKKVLLLIKKGGMPIS